MIVGSCALWIASILKKNESYRVIRSCFNGGIGTDATEIVIPYMKCGHLTNTVVDFSPFEKLKKLEIGSNNFDVATGLRVVGLTELETVDIGKAFTYASLELRGICWWVIDEQTCLRSNPSCLARMRSVTVRKRCLRVAASRRSDWIDLPELKTISMSYNALFFKEEGDSNTLTMRSVPDRGR